MKEILVSFFQKNNILVSKAKISLVFWKKYFWNSWPLIQLCYYFFPELKIAYFEDQCIFLDLRKCHFFSQIILQSFWISFRQRNKSHSVFLIIFQNTLLCSMIPNLFYVKVRFTQKMLVKSSKCHSSEPFFVPEEGGKFKMMSGTDKMLIFSFFCISKINQ